ncbi:peroxisomal ATPase PEX1 isoform X1 [Pelobates fuscus]|uniref:peroxisomal ATPase PEX1 isoform X1 n=1 Tax=Pelobates fuscus TaxID=191477 RepID=UPI002FE4B932
MIGAGLVGVSVRLCRSRDSFLHLTPELRAQLRLEQNHAVEVSWGENPVYLGWIETRSRGDSGYNSVELNRQFGETLGLSDGQQVFLKQCSNVVSCKEITVEPLSSDDWEILELHASALETQLLDQIRVVYPKAIFPVWVDQHTCIYIQIGALSPPASYGRLEPLTELIVAPKTRGSEAFSPLRSDEFYRGSRSIQDPKTSVTTGTSSGSLSTDGETGLVETENIPSEPSIWDTLGNLFLNAIGRKSSTSPEASAKDLFARTLLRSIDLEAVFRVSNSVPPIIRSSQAYSDHLNDNTVQVFLWYPEPPGLISDVVLSFGHIVELPSPKRRREIANTKAEGHEKSKIKPEDAEKSTPVGVGTQRSKEVVKIVWHGFEDLKDVIEYDTRNGNTHIAKVWVPETLRKRLNINVSSAVHIQSCDSFPKISASITLQPTESLDRETTEEDVKSAFTSWLQSSSTLKVPWVLGEMTTINIPIEERMMEFLVRVNPATEETSEDNFYMLCPSFLPKTKINVILQPLASDERSRVEQFDQSLPYLQTQNLGGFESLVTSCYEHVVHCLMGRPLSRQLVAMASGLRSGAILISGVKGCGKTTLARALCKEAFDNLEAHVEEISCKLLKGKTFENIHQALEELFAEAAWRQPSVVLLDDLDHIVGIPSTPELEHSPEAVQSKQLAYVLKGLMKDIITMDTQIAVIATSLSDRSLNPILIPVQGTHLFQCLKTIHPPTQEQRSEMLRCVIENRLSADFARFEELDLNQLAKETEGFLATDFTLLVERAIESSVATRKVYRKTELDLSMSNFTDALKGFTPLSLRKAHLHKPKSQGWSMVGGLHDVRQTLKDTIELPAKYPELFANLPIRHKSGVLLYGAPGTGKTLLASVIAHESGMNFISVKGPELLSKYIGASEQAVRDVFTRAEAAKPCILFFDEFDSIAPRRGHDNTGVTDRVVNQMLTQLDGVEGLQGVYVLAASSRPDLIDPALLRPGRLDECLYCPPPDQISRIEILKGLSHSMLLDDDVNFRQIAALTENFTGADLKALLYNAQLEAIHSSLSPSLPQDNGSGSDSDVSLSSMIFVNPSSGSDESAGESDSALEQSLASLDIVKLPPEDSKSSIWRLYFGSSYESDLGNSSTDQTSQSLSGSNSITLDFTCLSVGELVPSQPLMPITSSQEDPQELNQEHFQKLNDEISVTKANFTNVENLSRCQPETKNKLCVCQHHLMTALSSTRPSISQEEWRVFNDLYDSFKNPKRIHGEAPRRSQKVTLA